MKYLKVENDKIKIIASKNYNYTFNKISGNFIRWGKTEKDDPIFSPFGPEILDLEVSTICSGINNKPCPWCYKSNTLKGKNMSFETFKTIIDKMPDTLTQIAFGIGNLDANKDLFKMFKYARKKGIIPNITINGWNLTDKQTKDLVKYCGAVAVSNYEDKNVCYNAVKKLSDFGLKQINIHQLLASETINKCFEVLKDSKTDERLKNLNAIVFLHLKPKGKRNTFKVMTDDIQYKKLINFALNNNINFGFDSCGAPKFLNAVKDHKLYERFLQLAEPCESGIFSAYINVNGEYFPCSFMEGEKGYKKGLDILNCNSFLEDIWYNKKTKEWRKTLINNKDNNNCRLCPYFNIY